MGGSGVRSAGGMSTGAMSGGSMPMPSTGSASVSPAGRTLSGLRVLVTRPDGQAAINTTGNPALATAGSGDVLSGLCGALLARGLPVREAALAAVWLHGAAADAMVGEGIGPVGVTAGELPAYIRHELNRR